MTVLLGAIATAYGMGAGLSSLLQARRMRRRGTSGDVSLGFLASYLGGYAIWFAYGLSIGSVPLIAVDAVGLVCGGVTLLVAMRLRPAPKPAVADAPSADDPQILRERAEIAVAVLGDDDEVLDAHAEPLRHVDAGLDRHHVAREQLVLGARAEARPLVDLDPDAVADAVAELVAVAGIGDRLARRGVHRRGRPRGCDRVQRG